MGRAAYQGAFGVDHGATCPEEFAQNKNPETSLIEQFLYPKYGLGRMWEEVGRQVREMGGEIHTNYSVIGLKTDGWRVRAVEAVNAFHRPAHVRGRLLFLHRACQGFAPFLRRRATGHRAGGFLSAT